MGFTIQSNPNCVVIYQYSLQTNKQSKDGICRSHSIFRNGNYRDYVRNENPRNDSNHIGGTSRGRTTTTTTTTTTRTRTSERSDTNRRNEKQITTSQPHRGWYQTSLRRQH